MKNLYLFENFVFLYFRIKSNNLSFGPDLKMYWFAVTRPGLQETPGSKFFFDAQSCKIFFSHKCIILTMLILESKVNFLFFLLYLFFSCSCCFAFSYPLPSAQVSLDCTTISRQINRWEASTAAIRNTNDEENFQM